MLSPVAKAQFSSVMAYDAGITNGGATIVRNMSATEVVTYVYTGGKHRFTYENNTTLAYSFFDLPTPSAFDKIEIHDFRIINDVLYFCGRDLNANTGVLGTFKAIDMLNPVGTTVQVDYFDVPNTTMLNRMEAYADPTASGNPRVAAVGYLYGSCGASACGVWVDCEGFAPGSMTANVSVFDSYYGTPNDYELWEDVVSTNDWVVLVGFGQMGGQQKMILRRFPKGNPTDPEIDNMYLYDEREIVATNETRAVAIKTNDLAVAYRGVRSDNTTDFTKFRIFDINWMKNINSQEYVIPYKSYLWEMAYMERANRVVVLNDFPTPAFLSNFVYLIPYQSTTYNSVFVNDDDWHFYSVTNLDGNFFVGAGPFHFLLRDASAAYPANSVAPPPALCPADDVMKVGIINNVVSNKIIEPLSGLNYPGIIPSQETDTIYSGSLTTRCFSY